MITCEVLVPAALLLGEGPIRRGESGFACVDIRSGRIFEGTLDGKFDLLAHTDATVGSIAETNSGDLLVAGVNHIELLGEISAIHLNDADSDLRFNDGKPDPIGRFICGTMADPSRKGAGGLWSFANGVASNLIAEVTISNGLCWSSDGSTMFYIDTPTQQVDAFDYEIETGEISNRRAVVEIPAEAGAPDGMTIDAEGGLWVALWGGGALHRYVDGRLDDIVVVPTPFVTCPVFVGADLQTLLITTASEPNVGQPGAGDIYVANPGVAGNNPNFVNSSTVFGSTLL